MDEYRYPDQNPDPAQQPRRRRRTADPAEGAAVHASVLPQAPAAPPFPPEAEPEQAAQPTDSRFQPEQPWLARPGFAPEQRTIRRAPVQDLYRYTQPAQEPPMAAPRPAHRVVKPPVTEESPAAAAPANTALQPMPAGDSYFDGKLRQLIGYAILGFLVTVLTLGLCYPWALCKQYGWRIKHTVIQGRRLTFDGKATQLFGRWLLWLLLTVVTLGIYSLWVGIALEKWRVKHTHFAE
jgi:hypothetical protein